MGFRDRVRGIARPNPDFSPVDPEELRLRLLRLNQPAEPWLVRDGAAEKVDLVVEWKTSDPNWKDLLSEVGVNDTFSTRLRFHARAHEVRSTDRCFAGDWYSDENGGRYYRESWQNGQLHDVAERTVNGQRYRFDSKDFKNILKQAITDAGWSYRAVVMRKL
ncbi:hypothetical protein MFM001_16840 [Mycobacterium sp. MFM001]|uniref:hypothetical protein n=1 Tax=Mycobacterium sp. MFM001 TaxID=2049453 RepID=UPI000DA552D5|nr:hypothetical protein [Mycobacterium sp. MFM001]GBE65222.1 hypothetical protein MFM001_16840 [Mycobacterium sp. MFM001]